MPPLRACRMGLRNLDGIQKLESVRCDRCGSCPDVLPRPQRSAVTSCAKPSRVWALLVPRNTGMVSCRCCVPAAWERSKPPPDCLYCALTGGAAHLSLPRNPDSELTLPGNGRPSGVFSGGGRTDSVEAFAGAQGQRGERGCEIGGWERRASSCGAADRKRTPAHNASVMRCWPSRPASGFGA